MTLDQASEAFYNAPSFSTAIAYAKAIYNAVITEEITHAEGESLMDTLEPWIE